MDYPLEEKIGQPQLLVGRSREFSNFNKWINNITRKISKSRVILARRKSGKTSFAQRLYNQIWSENGLVVPFYYDFGENKVWYPDLAVNYYCTFVSQYVSFLERDPAYIKNTMTLQEIREYGISKSLHPLATDAEIFEKYYSMKSGFGIMWKTAYSAPHRYADLHERRVLVILDEFQNITQYVYWKEDGSGEPDETMAGSFHYYSESKIAPMLVTGSYVGWLLNIISQYLEAGRLSAIFFAPYLEPEDGLEAVYRYAEVFQEPITNETAIQINELCMSDPFFISCVIQSNYLDKDLTTSEGVVNTVEFEISDRKSEMSQTWAEYIDLTVDRVNSQNAKSMLLYLSKNADRYWTPTELKEILNLDLEISEIQKRLITLAESDLLARGTSDIQFRGLQDGTLNLILRSRFEQEIEGCQPDFKQEFSDQTTKLQRENRRLRGRLSHLSGKMAEHLFAAELRSKQRISLSTYFDNVVDDTPLHLIDVRERWFFQRGDGKNSELDVRAQSNDGRVLLIEVRKHQVKMGVKDVEDFLVKIESYKESYPADLVVPAFLSLGGFTDEAKSFCQERKIATAERLVFLDDIGE